jgi:DNA-directed RNA polymerase subunit L
VNIDDHNESLSPILIVKLRPQESINCTMSLIKKRGYDNASFSTVSRCFYTHKINETRVKNAYTTCTDKKQFELHDRHTHTFIEENRFNFYVESLGTSSGYKIMMDAFKTLKTNIQKFNKRCTEVAEVKEDSGFYDILVGEGYDSGVENHFSHTIGNLIQGILYDECVGSRTSNDGLIFIGYRRPHPLDNSLHFRIKWENGIQKNCIECFSTMVEERVLKKITECMKSFQMNYATYQNENDDDDDSDVQLEDDEDTHEEADPVEELELSEHDALRVDALMDQYDDPDNVLATLSGSSAFVTHRSLHTLQDGKWLNDEVMNYYVDLMAKQNKEADCRPKCGIVNSFFYAKLMEGGGEATYKNVKRFSKKRNIDVFDIDKLIVPMNINGNHWVFAVVNFLEKQIEYYDSLSGPPERQCKALKAYLQGESLSKRDSDFDFTGWKYCVVPNHVPQQGDNSVDCGVFTLKGIECVSKGQPLTYTQAGMPRHRRRIAAIITEPTENNKT